MPDVILPVLDEAEALPWVLERMPGGFNPIVIDNGSTDGSATVAARLGAKVISAPQRGFGAACFAGLIAAEAPVVCFMDADGSLDPRELPLVAVPILEDQADLTLGARQVAVAGAWPPHAQIANRALAREVYRRSGHRLRDIGPMRAARREPLLELGVVDRRYGWPLEMILRAARAGWRIREVEVSYGPRHPASSPGTRSATGRATGFARTLAGKARAERGAVLP